MNGSTDKIKEILGLLENSRNKEVELVVALPSVYLSQMKSICTFEIACQNIYTEEKGGFTGEISASMLKDIGINWVIIGHSERRALFGETNEVVKKKVSIALEKGLSVILCIGETGEEKEKELTFTVLKEQLEIALLSVSNEDITSIVIAYEPVWAIGTGRTPEPNGVQEVHMFIRKCLESYGGISKEVRIIYGGSVNEKNCHALKKGEDVDGFLVGGACMKEGFVEIVNSCGINN
eukprot:GHVP01054262.1.p1 GENE.GHVP01054262.1~~GHVP01054262.1.p1  ORF type:complete len:250 (-),score=50.46 GHVP01054262.1:83-790(-)